MRLSSFLFIAAILSLSWWSIAGCTKEYSYEGGSLPDSSNFVPAPDTTRQDSLQFLPCALCVADSFGKAVDTWRIQLPKSKACGNFTRTVITPTRDAFTFFGPSACSIDSGLILNSFWSPLVFDRDLKNVSTQRTAFYYYDRIGNTFVLERKTGQVMTIVIEEYSHSTGIAKGYAFGEAQTADGKLVRVSDIRFVIKIP
ncbi:MAG: hypothetical protein LCH58_16970 [Bacteroidetes bacterium]|uniref:hypothetical protein n=1 Tax=Phnomibacter sp. TaxID=2836217 RepID=UPI002FDF0927|nr:hypothetical protein [Bacteroidota bacterium]